MAGRERVSTETKKGIRCDGYNIGGEMALTAREDSSAETGERAVARHYCCKAIGGMALLAHSGEEEI